MFDGYSLKNCLPSNTILIKKPLESNEHHYSIGNPKWQQTYTTCSRMYYTEKDLRNNICDLSDKPYLFPNHSNFLLGPYSDKYIYQSSNKNDYHLPEMTPYEKDKFQKNFIEKKDDGLGDENNKDSMYNLKMKNPKEQKQNFDYDSIKFKTDNFVVDTITQQEKPKENNCWAFDYFNKDKNNHHINVPLMVNSVNNDIDKRSRKKKYKHEKKQVWDPIANRFFECES